MQQILLLPALHGHNIANTNGDEDKEIYKGST